MTRLPTPGQDNGTWGNILNDYLSVAHNTDGTLKLSGDIATAKSTAQSAQQTATTAQTTANAAYVKPTNGIPKTDLSSSVQASLSNADAAIAGTAPDASPTTKGLIQLTGDLGGTATAPTVPGLSAKETAITPGTTSQYYRGDKTWQTLDKTAVSLSNVDNTSDINKPVSTAVQAALNAKADQTATISASIVTTKGDLLTATGSATLARLAAGTNGQVLTADSSQAGGVKWSGVSSTPVWVVNVKDYGAVGNSNGTTGNGADDTAAFRAAYAAAIAQQSNGWVNVEIFVPGGVYRVTDFIVDTPDAAGGAQTRINGLRWSGTGKRSSEIFFDRAGGVTADPRLNNLFILGNRAAGWRFEKLSFRSLDANNSCFYLWSRDADDTTLTYPEYGTGNNQDFGFTQVEWRGTWLRGLGLDGDQQANLNSEFFMNECAISNEASFADAFVRSGITASSTNTQQDQFLNYWFTNCKFEYSSGTLLRYDRGGSININGGSYIGVNGANTVTFFYIPPMSSHFESTCRLAVRGVRFEIRGANQKVIDCGWNKGNISFDSCHDSGLSFQSFAATTAAHVYNFNNTVSRGPMISYRDCELIGYHSYTTNASTAVTDGVARYESCRFINQTVAVGASGFIRSSGVQVPYRVLDCWGVDDQSGPAPTKLNGVAVTGIPTAGQVPVASSATAAVWGTVATGSGGSSKAWRLRDLRSPAEVDTLATAPTITLTQSSTSTISGAVLAAPNTAPFLYRGAAGFQFGTAFPDTLMYLPTSRYPHTYASPQTVWSVPFGTDASAFELYFKYITSTCLYRLKVDGRRVTDLPQATGATATGTRHVLKFDFGTAVPRVITLEFFSLPFGGIYLPPSASIWRPRQMTTRWAVLGDSISAGSAQNTGFNNGTWVPRFADYVGWDDPYNEALGGTGYITAGTSDTFANRVSADIIAYAPDRVIVWGGYNDASGSQSAISTAANALYATIVSGLPSAEVYVFGCWSPTGSPGATLVSTDATLQAAALANGLPFISTITGNVYSTTGATLAATGAFITGTGHVGATTGTGNADLYVGTDGIHPTDAGHLYLARRFVSAMSYYFSA